LGTKEDSALRELAGKIAGSKHNCRSGSQSRRAAVSSLTNRCLRTVGATSRTKRASPSRTTNGSTSSAPSGKRLASSAIHESPARRDRMSRLTQYCSSTTNHQSTEPCTSDRVTGTSPSGKTN